MVRFDLYKQGRNHHQTPGPSHRLVHEHMSGIIQIPGSPIDDGLHNGIGGLINDWHLCLLNLLQDLV